MSTPFRWQPSSSLSCRSPTASSTSVLPDRGTILTVLLIVSKNTALGETCYQNRFSLFFLQTTIVFRTSLFLTYGDCIEVEFKALFSFSFFLIVFQLLFILKYMYDLKYHIECSWTPLEKKFNNIRKVPVTLIKTSPLPHSFQIHYAPNFTLFVSFFPSLAAYKERIGNIHLKSLQKVSKEFNFSFG